MRLSSLAAATVLLLAAACSSEPEVREPDPTPAPAATRSAAAPTMPAQAKEDSSEGDVAFVLHWIEVFNTAARTGDTKALRGLSAPSCAGCSSYIKLFETTYKQGGFFRGSDWKAADLEIERSDDASFVYARVTAPGGTVRPSKSASEKPGDPEDSELVFEVHSTEAGKKVRTLERSE